MPVIDCVCGHTDRWHMKHASGIDHRTIRTSRCLSKVKNERGFPRACDCRSFKAQTKAGAA
jgi:hypothetical protein